MAQGDKFNIYLIDDSSGKYITADLQPDGTYTITHTISSNPLADKLFLKNLPKDWDKTELVWERNPTYHGVFRSMSTNYNFVLDGRAILLHLYSIKNTQAQCTMRIDVLREESNIVTPTDVWKYDKFYVSQIDFSELKDNKKEHTLVVSTLDSKLYTLLKSNAQKNFNLPFWEFTPGPDTWAPTADTEFITHPGIKVIWSNNYISGATASSPIAPPGAGDLYGFNHGSVSDARHWIPAMNQYNIVQNNGTTTFLGNDILQPLLIQQNQAFNYNRNFDGPDDIKAYTQNRALVKNLLKNPTDADNVDVRVTISGEFLGNITYPNGTIYTHEFIGFVLFEIDNKDECTKVGGNYFYSLLYSEPLPASGSPYTPPAGGFTATVDMNLVYDRSYILGIIYDDTITGISGQVANVALSKLELKIESMYNSGTATSVDGPRFPPSTFPAMRAITVCEKLVSVIDSTATDAYGFPTGGGAYNFESNYLNNNSANRADDYDLKAYNLMMTSENAVRLVRGQTYLSTSLQEIFSSFFAISEMGLGIINVDTIKMEPLPYFYDNATLIYDLSENVANFTIEPLTDIKADNIKAGYTAPQTNNNFGVDSYLIPTEYATQLVNTPKDLNLVASSVIVDQNQIEKARAQGNQSEQSNPSASNSLIMIDTDDSTVTSVDVVDPGGNAVTVTPYAPLMYPAAQSVTSGTPPYIRGLYYPETAINLSLTPASNMYRLGGFIDSICYGTDVMAFRKQYQMQYNNTAVELPGIAKNLSAGFIQEVADIAIPYSPLTPDKLFRPDLFTIETISPVNLYSVINSGNPYGYIQFKWINPYTGVRTTYKGFIWKISQKIGNNASTTITLLAHPDTTDDDINAA